MGARGGPGAQNNVLECLQPRAGVGGELSGPFSVPPQKIYFVSASASLTGTRGRHLVDHQHADDRLMMIREGGVDRDLRSAARCHLLPVQNPTSASEGGPAAATHGNYAGVSVRAVIHVIHVIHL